MKITLPFFIAGILSPVLAQSNALRAGAGYSGPAPFQVAPGQIVTLFVRGVAPSAGWQLRAGQAANAPLPNTLAGLSVKIVQAHGDLLRAPTLAVRQEDECGESSAGDTKCLLTSVKVQIPFELSADVTVSGGNQVAFAPLAQLSIDVDGRAGRQFPVQPVPDNAHVRQVYHADGRVVDEKAPAAGGETLVVYLHRLGQTSPAATSAAESPSGAAVTELLGHPRADAPFQRNFLNALSSAPRTLTLPPADSDILPVISADLASGQIGVYRLNIPLPQPLSSFYPCGDGVRSNAILNVRTSQGTEGIALCVQP